MNKIDLRSKFIVFFITVFLALFQDAVFFLLICLLSIYMIFLGYRKEAFRIICIIAIITILRTISKGNGFSIVIPEMFLFMLTRTMAILMAAQPIITTSPGEVVAVMNKMKIHKNISLPLIFMMRFLPTIKFEFKEIVDSLRLRNIYSWKKPLLTMEYIFVPIMFSSSKAAEELAAAAEVRGISSNGEHSSRRELKLKVADILIIIVSLFSTMLLIYLDKVVFV